MHLSGRHWIIGILLATTLHVAGFAAVLWQRDTTGAANTGIGGIEFALGPAGGAPGTMTNASIEDAETVETAPAEYVQEVETIEAPLNDATTLLADQPEVDPLQTQPTELMAQTPVEDIEPLPDVESPAKHPLPQVMPEPVVSEEPTIEMATEPDPVVVRETAVAPRPTPPAPKAKPIRRPAAVARTTMPPEPERQAKVRPETARNDVQPEMATDDPAAGIQNPPGAGGKAGTADRPDAGSATASTRGGGTPGTEADYAAKLLAWLERHKKYPRRAQRRQQEGVVLLYIEIDRSGRILSHRVQRSSGFRALDDATIDMLERANPLPPLPERMHGDRLEIIVPVQFHIA